MNMLLTKKNKFTVDEGRIKEDVLSPEGKLLLKINLRYPDIKCRPRDAMAAYAKDFYLKLAVSFADYAKNELLKCAQSAYLLSPESFLPFSALMKYSITHEDESFLSIVQDISVSDGRSVPAVDRKTQVWEREYGTKCRLSYFVSKKETDEFIKENLKEEHKKRFERELFALRDGGLEFYLRGEDGYSSIFMPLDVQKIDLK